MFYEKIVFWEKRVEEVERRMIDGWKHSKAHRSEYTRYKPIQVLFLFLSSVSLFFFLP